MNREDFLRSIPYLDIMNDDFFTFFTKYGAITQTECKNFVDCKFSLNNQKVVWIPPPKRDMKGVIISRDPTTAFLNLYNEAIQENSESCRIKLMSNKGVPVRTIIDRIEKVCQRKQIGFSRDALSYFILNNCYWTHLLKCYTVSNYRKDIESLSFSQAKKCGCVDCCSKKWLNEEIIRILKTPEVRVIILLGKDVKNFVYNNYRNEEVEILPLPHPSKANGKVWAQIDDSLLENIKKLIKICNE